MRRTKYDLSGKKFHAFTVIDFAGYNHLHKSMWNVICVCGNKRVVQANALMRGNSKSCGCQHRDFMIAAKGKRIGKLTGSIWCRIKHNAKRRGFDIVISQLYCANLFDQQNERCALSGEKLILDAPMKYVTASLDRIDSSQGYDEDNVQWVHKEVNRMKTNFLQSDFLGWVNKIHSFTKQPSVH